MAILRLPGQEFDKLMRDIDLQMLKTEELSKKIDITVSITKNLLRILKHSHEKKTDQDSDSRRSDTVGQAGAEQEKTV